MIDRRTTIRTRDRLARQFFSSMPARAQASFYLGVFFCFAPLGLSAGLGSLRVPAWWEVALLMLYSGGVAIAYAATGTRAPKWLPLPIAAHLLSTVAIRAWIPERPAPESLGPDETAALRTWLIASGVLTVGSLAGAFTAFSAMIRFEGLRFIAAHTEIRLARDIHASLVPVVEGRAAGLEWRGSSHPSGDVGGDLVDVVATDGRWTAVVADVSGHGVAAGVVMGMFKTAVRGAIDTAPDTGALASRINAVLAPLRQPHMFVTAACVRLRQPGELEFVLAGHPPLLHLRAETGRAEWVGESSLALTLIDHTTYQARALPISAGDVVVILTDGLLEVFDAQDRELGADGIRHAVEQAGAAGPLARLEAAILDAARRHGPQLDDQTLLLVRATPRAPAP